MRKSENGATVGVRPDCWIEQKRNSFRAIPQGCSSGRPLVLGALDSVIYLDGEEAARIHNYLERRNREGLLYVEAQVFAGEGMLLLCALWRGPTGDVKVKGRIMGLAAAGQIPV